MLTRTAAHGAATGEQARRRQRRRAGTANHALYCATNGCTSLLLLDPEARRATCAICGFTRRLG